MNNHAHILRPKKGNVQYFVDLLESIDYAAWVTGSAQPKLTAENLASIQIPVPTEEEQALIENYLTSVQTKINQAIHRIQSEVTLLEEYRTALINEVITGKRCVLDNDAQADVYSVQSETLTLAAEPLSTHIQN